MILQLIVVLAVALMAVLFTFQNPHHVQMHFMAWQTRDFPIIAVILVSALIGVILTALMSLKNSLGLQLRIRRLESELSQLKNSAAQEMEAADEDEKP
jgi:uncharacterized integral membrane protein